MSVYRHDRSVNIKTESEPNLKHVDIWHSLHSKQFSEGSSKVRRDFKYYVKVLKHSINES